MITPIHILLPGVCYCLCFLLFYWVWKIKSSKLTSLNVQRGNWTALHLRHAGGLIFMVLIPLFFLPGITENLLTWPENISRIKVIVLIITSFILITLAAKDAENTHDKKINYVHWPSGHILLHIVLRNLFLAGYEWFFRGLILFSCMSLVGEIPAIIINIALYAIIHSFNGKKEITGSIPLGLILCLFTLWWHSVWPAILLHIALSSSYETVILHHFFWKPSKHFL